MALPVEAISRCLDSRDCANLFSFMLNIGSQFGPLQIAAVDVMKVTLSSDLGRGGWLPVLEPPLEHLLIPIKIRSVINGMFFHFRYQEFSSLPQYHEVSSACRPQVRVAIEETMELDALANCKMTQ